MWQYKGKIEINQNLTGPISKCLILRIHPIDRHILFHHDVLCSFHCSCESNTMPRYFILSIFSNSTSLYILTVMYLLCNFLFGPKIITFAYLDVNIYHYFTTIERFNKKYF